MLIDVEEKLARRRDRGGAAGRLPHQFGWVAEAFAIDDPVDPREPRAYLCRFIDAPAESSRNDRRALKAGSKTLNV